MALRPEIRGQLTLRSANLDPSIRSMATETCPRCGGPRQELSGCGSCTSRDEQMGSGMQDPPLSPGQH